MIDYNKFTSLPWLEQGTILLAKHGSHAYGTNIATSDLDVKGVAIPPADYFHGFLKRFEQAECHEPDLVIYDVRKFFALAADCNPNIMEILWVDPSDYLKITPAGERLVAARELFLSKKAKHTFSGYAISQLKRINTHHRWLVNPPSAPPTRAEFGLPEQSVISSDDRMAAESRIQKIVETWDVDLEPLAPSARIAMQSHIARSLAEMKIASDEKWNIAGRVLGFSENFIEAMGRERAYRAKQREWDSFRNWQETRNPVRAELEAKHGFDCYADDTEFLTANGWRRFDDIGTDTELATVFVRRDCTGDEKMEHRKFLGVEYQKYIDRFKGQYTGTMYHLTGYHTDTLVTPNHRMLFSSVARVSRIKSDWILEEASWLPDQFDILAAPRPRTKNYSNGTTFSNLPIPDRAYMTLLGWYLSDGCAIFDSDGDKRPVSVRISQKLGGKLSWSMSRWHGDHGNGANTSLFEYARKPNAYNPETIIERVLEVRHPAIVLKIISECGTLDRKRIPRWVFGLSKRLIDITLRSLIGGDGTVREHVTKSDSFIYYSKDRPLADDVQELGLMGGWETALWGPYDQVDIEGREIQMYQVHLRPDIETRRFVRSTNVAKINVVNQRVVCFTVPNGTLITRRNGKIGIHGNSKHGMHLVRLLKMCREILETGKVIVKRPDAEEMLAIRNGAWSYEQIVEWAAREDAELDIVAKTSKLPHAPDRNALDALCCSIVEEML